MPFPEAHGGGGFPWLLATAMQELLTASNMGFSLCPLLTQGAIDMLEHHGSEEQQEVYLRRMVTGEWTGHDEPHRAAGRAATSAPSRPSAVPADDGSWRITGQKIFITYGEQDLTEQHRPPRARPRPRRAARAPGASAASSSRRSSTSGERNAVRCIGIEHKMGIHASPTCTMEYDGAVGYLIGEANAGMRYMFTMMNTARLSVGLEGLCLAERAYQAAVSYATERHAGPGTGRAEGSARARSSTTPTSAGCSLHMRAHIEAMRGLAYTNAWAIDVAKHGADEDARARGQELADLLTPITKAWCTDLGSELTRLATQVHGGMGYISETGVEQHERDIRIAAIYEGTNGIQAMDLVGRKLPMRMGGAVTDQIAAIEATVAELDATGELAGLGTALADAVAALREATDWLLAKGVEDPQNALAGAAPYLRLFGTVLGGWFLARQALAARARRRRLPPGQGDDRPLLLRAGAAGGPGARAGGDRRPRGAVRHPHDRARQLVAASRRQPAVRSRRSRWRLAAQGRDEPPVRVVPGTASRRGDLRRVGEQVLDVEGDGVEAEPVEDARARRRAPGRRRGTRTGPSSYSAGRASASRLDRGRRGTGSAQNRRNTSRSRSGGAARANSRSSRALIDCAVPQHVLEVEVAVDERSCSERIERRRQRPHEASASRR